MNVLKTLVVALLFAACGQGGTPLTGASDTQRGEANAINPARNVQLYCQDKAQNQNAGVTVNITNNCTKNNVEGVPAEAEE